MYRFLTVLLSVTLGFTACTGGLFSIPFALATDADQTTLYTPIDLTFACTSFSPASSAVQDAKQKAGSCGDGQECLSQGGTSARTQLTSTHDTLMSAHAVVVAFAINDPRTNDDAFTLKNGPSPPWAHDNIHILAKRE